MRNGQPLGWCTASGFSEKVGKVCVERNRLWTNPFTSLLVNTCIMLMLVICPLFSYYNISIMLYHYYAITHQQIWVRQTERSCDCTYALVIWHCHGKWIHLQIIYLINIAIFSGKTGWYSILLYKIHFYPLHIGSFWYFLFIYRVFMGFPIESSIKPLYFHIVSPVCHIFVGFCHTSWLSGRLQALPSRSIAISCRKTPLAFVQRWQCVELRKFIWATGCDVRKGGVNDHAIQL